MAAFLGVVFARGAAWDRDRGGRVGRRGVPPLLVAVPDGPRARARVTWIPRRAQLPERRDCFPGWSSSASTPRCSSPTHARFASRSGSSLPTEPPPSWIVVAAEPITDVDTTAADMLEDLDRAINAAGVSLVFAEMKDPVRARSSATRSRGRSIRRTSSRHSMLLSLPTVGRPARTGCRPVRRPLRRPEISAHELKSGVADQGGAYAEE